MKIFTTQTDAELANDNADPTIRMELIARRSGVVEMISRNLVSEADAEAGPVIRGLVMDHVRSVLGLESGEQPVSVEVIQVSVTGKEFKSKGWMRPDEVS